MARTFYDDRDASGASPLLREERALVQLRALYRKVDAVLAPFGCARSAACCLLSRTGRQPHLFPIEFRALRAVLGLGRWREPRADGGCPLLDASGRRCTAYEERPFGCRTFFCERVRPLAPCGARKPPEDALRMLTARLARLSDAVDPDANPRPLLELLRGER